MKQKKKINQKRKKEISFFEVILLTLIVFILFIIALNIYGIVIIGVIPVILFFYYTKFNSIRYKRRMI